MVESIRTQKITGCWQIEDLVNFPKKKNECERRTCTFELLKVLMHAIRSQDLLRKYKIRSTSSNSSPRERKI